MKTQATIFLMIMMLFSSLGCKKDSVTINIDSNGTIQKQGITTYQYGTHVLIDNTGKTTYALGSDDVDLDKFINKKINRICGRKVKGYPVDGGPDYIVVSNIK
jgi:hypothetical protein